MCDSRANAVHVGVNLRHVRIENRQDQAQRKCSEESLPTLAAPTARPWPSLFFRNRSYPSLCHSIRVCAHRVDE